MSAVSKVLVVGGGVGGLTAAIALRQQGIAVDLIESNPRHSVYGVGIIQPNNTLRALDSIGLAQACVENGAPYPGWRIHDADGRFVLDVPNTSEAAPGLPPVNGIPRPLLQKIMLDAARAEGAHIRTGLRMTSSDEVGEQVHARFSDGSEGDYDLVVGCDGLYSEMRRTLFPDAPRPVFSGEGVWRYNFARPPGLEWGEIYYGRSTKVGLVPMSPSTMYMFLVTHEPDNPRFDDGALAEIMRGKLADYTGVVAELREQVVDPALVVYRPMEHLLLPAPWYVGRTVLIGDAVHATTPHLAQGAAMAIEDAVLLAELLGRDAPLPALLDEFMRRRFPRARHVVESSTQIAEWEIEAWAGIDNPHARPGELLGEATQALMEAY